MRMLDRSTHVATGARQYGHALIWAAQSPHAHWWPHGVAAWVFWLTKQMMHVVSPPMVDSGASGRPVEKLASASETGAETGGGGYEGGCGTA